MSEHDHPNLPDWAERDRAADLAWIEENVHIFWPDAQLGYETYGRGAIVVDTTSRPTGEGHPFVYFSREMIERTGDEDAQRMASEYDPTGEFVAVLLKIEDQVSSYRLQVCSDTEKPTPQPPDLQMLMEWEEEGFCEATDGCVVESDGTCPHGHRSWLLELGLI